MYMKARAEGIEQRKLEMQGLYDPVIIDGIVTDYGINRQGDVYSYINGRLLKPMINIDGKPQVTLSYIRNGKHAYHRKNVDHLVAMTYLTNPLGCKYIEHIDGDPANCSPDNLFWTNYKDASTAGYSMDDMVKIFNSIRDTGECENVQDWVVDRFKAAISHMQRMKMSVEFATMIEDMRFVVSSVGTNDKYQISRFGIIKNTITNRFILGTLNHYGYIDFTIFSANDHQKLHRLVAYTFLPNPNGLSEVHHVNSNKVDPCVWNLEWVSHSENMKRGISLREYRVGEDKTNSKFTEGQIRKVCEMIDQKIYSPIKISEATGVSSAMIGSIRIGKAWKHIARQYKMPYCTYDSSGRLIGIDQEKTAKLRQILDSYERPID